jgi:hypothetical protein
MLTTWWIWKHHNEIISDNEKPNVTCLLDTINMEADQWVNGLVASEQIFEKWS